MTEVIQIIGSYQTPPELRLRNASTAVGSQAGVANGTSHVTSGANQSAGNDGVEVTEQSTAIASDSDASDSILSGVEVSADEPQATVDVIDQGDLEGTICDCGEITVPGGGFPKWPLLFLAAIPFFFIHGCDDCDKPTPTPSIPTTPEVPEPGSLLLFGSGLAAIGAGLRRRYARAKLAAQIQEADQNV
jgi:hypothetical protein